METIEKDNLELIYIDSALRDGAHLTGSRSVGGLRIVRIVLNDSVIGYGEHPHIKEALKYANEDLKAGGRKYSEVYGLLYPHYITGSSNPSDNLDRWILSGNTIEAIFKDESIQITLKGNKGFKTPMKISNRVIESQKAFEWEDRGFKFLTLPGNWFNGKAGITTEIISKAPNKKSPWFYEISKTGSAKTFTLALNIALNAEEVES